MGTVRSVCLGFVLCAAMYVCLHICMYVCMYVLVSPLGGPHRIRGVGKSVTDVAPNRAAKCWPFPSERGYRGRLIIEAGPAPRLHFWPTISGPALAPLNW
jgi:hypothetical protein